jgi:hypothetical protein
VLVFACTSVSLHNFICVEARDRYRPPQRVSCQVLSVQRRTWIIVVDGVKAATAFNQCKHGRRENERVQTSSQKKVASRYMDYG